MYDWNIRKREQVLKRSRERMERGTRKRRRKEEQRQKWKSKRNGYKFSNFRSSEYGKPVRAFKSTPTHKIKENQSQGENAKDGQQDNF